MSYAKVFFLDSMYNTAYALIYHNVWNLAQEISCNYCYFPSS